MTNYTLIGGDQKEYGPVTDEQLRQWIREGRVSQQSQAMAEGDTEWRPISAFPEFAGMFGGGTAGSTPLSASSLQTIRLKTRLKWLLSMEVLCVVCTLVMAMFNDQLLPEELRNYEASIAAAPTTLMGWIVVAVYLITLPTALAATIGLFLNWRLARALFLWTRITIVAMTPFQGTNVEPAWAGFFDAAAILIAGIVIGMLYCSQLKELYEKPKRAAGQIAAGSAGH